MQIEVDDVFPLNYENGLIVESSKLGVYSVYTYVIPLVSRFLSLFGLYTV